MNKLKVASLLVALMTPLVAKALPVTYDCTYTKYSDEKGLHNFTESLTPKYVWDKVKKTAYLIGNIGTEEVTAIEGVNLVTFIEVTAVGNVMTTAINSKGVSVHSRNTQGMPSQSYGTCTVK